MRAVLRFVEERGRKQGFGPETRRGGEPIETIEFTNNMGGDSLIISSVGGQVFIGINGAISPIISGSEPILYFGGYPNGTLSVTDISTVPEINPSSAPSALALVAGAVLIIRGRRTRKVPAA